LSYHEERGTGRRRVWSSDTGKNASHRFLGKAAKEEKDQKKSRRSNSTKEGIGLSTVDLSTKIPVGMFRTTGKNISSGIERARQGESLVGNNKKADERGGKHSVQHGDQR